MNNKQPYEEWGISINDGEAIVLKPANFQGFRAIHRDFPEIVGSGLDPHTAARDLYRLVEQYKQRKITGIVRKTLHGNPEPPETAQEAPEAQKGHNTPQAPIMPGTGENSPLWVEAPDHWPAVIYPPLHEGGIHERETFVAVHNIQSVSGFGKTEAEALEDMINRLSLGIDYEELAERARYIDRIRPIPEIQGFHDLLNFLLSAAERFGVSRFIPEEANGVLIGLCWVLGHDAATQLMLETVIKPALDHIDFEAQEITAFGMPFDMADLATVHNIKKDRGE